jgi:hypothetical protein
MEQNKTSLHQESKGAALASQEQEQVLPRVGELEDAELDFVAGGYGDIMVSSPAPQWTQAQSRNASPTSGETARPRRHFSLTLPPPPPPRWM